MHINSHRWLLVFLLLLCACFITSYGGRGGGGRGGGSRGGSSTRTRISTRYRATSRPATFRPATYRPAPAPTQRPAPKPTSRPIPPSPKPPSAPGEAVVAKQPASNPNFKETSPVQGSADKQPASNPNYKPDGGAPGGAPPPYSPGGQPAPSAPVGAPPAYQPPQGSPGQRPPYPVQPGGQAPPYPAQPPPYSGGPPGRPPAYPGLPTHPGSAPYPVQPGQGGHPQQPGGYRPYPGQPGGYPGQPGGYPGQPGGYPGGYPQQPGVNRPYPVQPGFYQPGVNRPYPQQQPLGSNVWQPQSGRASPPYMNYGGIPTGANMYSKPHQKKGFLGSVMSVGGGGSHKKNKYLGSPFGAGAAAGGLAQMGRRKSFLGKYGAALAIGSAAMFVILPFMAMRSASSMFMPRMGYYPMGYMPSNYHRHGMYPNGAHYYDIFDPEYFGRCQQPLRKEHYAEMKCKSSRKDVECGAKCEEGYTFPDNTTIQYNKCWHITGVWRPTKNYPECSPVCEGECLNGGQCTKPGYCSCPSEYRGSRCQIRKINFSQCDIRVLTKGKKVGWVCTHSKNETSCTVRCPEPGHFETPAADEYKCTPEGIWTPNSIPHCIVKDAEKT